MGIVVMSVGPVDVGGLLGPVRFSFPIFLFWSLARLGIFIIRTPWPDYVQLSMFAYAGREALRTSAYDHLLAVWRPLSTPPLNKSTDLGEGAWAHLQLPFVLNFCHTYLGNENVA